jgi:hypothetical protein
VSEVVALIALLSSKRAAEEFRCAFRCLMAYEPICAFRASMMGW